MSRTRKIVRRVAVGVGIASAVLLVLGLAFFGLRRPPIEPFEPVAWRPGPGMAVPDARAAGELRSVGGRGEEEFDGPEDVAVDADGRVYTSVRGGRIVRLDPDDGTVETFARVGDRPLGLAFDRDGDLIVANHGAGLQSVAPDGTVTLLTDVADEEPIRMANDVAIGDDGVIYFSDSNSVFHRGSLGEQGSFSVYDFLEGRPRGRLLAYDPATGRTTVLVTDLYFPNGIVIADDQRSLLVAESTRYRITRYWLDGARAGTSEVFADDVPGILDGMTADEDGNLLLPMYERVELLDRHILPGTVARQAVIRLPRSMVGGSPEGFVLVMSTDGEVVTKIDDIDPSPSNIVAHGEDWLLGSLGQAPVRRLPHSW